MVRKHRLIIVFAAALLLVLTAFGGFRQGVASAKPDQPQANAYYSYSVKYVCGAQLHTEPEFSVTRPGPYRTDINIHNYNPTVQAAIRKHVIMLAIGGYAPGREPNYRPGGATEGHYPSP